MGQESSAAVFLEWIDQQTARLPDDGPRRTDRAVSLAATGSPDTIRSIRRNLASKKQLGVSSETIRKFETYFESLITDPAAGSGGFLANSLAATKSRETSPAPEFDNPHVGPADVDVLGITVGGDDGDFWLNGEVVNKVRRPPGIRHAKNVFALNVGGDSMEPRHRPGDLIYVQKANPAPGDDIVIELKETNEGGDRKSFLKEFVRRAGSLVLCKQYNPARGLEFETREIANIYRVIPLKELMG